MSLVSAVESHNCGIQECFTTSEKRVLKFSEFFGCSIVSPFYTRVMLFFFSPLFAKKKDVKKEKVL